MEGGELLIRIDELSRREIRKRQKNNEGTDSRDNRDKRKLCGKKGGKKKKKLTFWRARRPRGGGREAHSTARPSQVSVMRTWILRGISEKKKKAETELQARCKYKGKKKGRTSSDPKKSRTLGQKKLGGGQQAKKET